jgi:uncharacterized membrane protein (UPF0182 family)
MAFAKMIRPLGRGNAVWMGLGLGLLALFAVQYSLDWVVDWLWMRQLGFEPVFWRILFARAGLFVAAFVPVLLYFWFNLRAIRRTVALSGEVHGTALSRVLGSLRGPWAGTAVLGISGVLALFLALSFQGAWQRFLLFWFGGSFGESEPILGQDNGFYVFDLPFLESVYGLLLTAVLCFRPSVPRIRLWPSLDRRSHRHGVAGGHVLRPRHFPEPGCGRRTADAACASPSLR